MSLESEIGTIIILHLLGFFVILSILLLEAQERHPFKRCLLMNQNLDRPTSRGISWKR